MPSRTKILLELQLWIIGTFFTMWVLSGFMCLVISCFGWFPDGVKYLPKLVEFFERLFTMFLSAASFGGLSTAVSSLWTRSITKEVTNEKVDVTSATDNSSLS
jgi:hypothetical protein